MISFQERLKRILIALSMIYLASLLSWALLQRLAPDRWWWLFLISSFAIYLFLPLIFILPIAFFVRRRSLWIGFGAALVLGLYLYGWVFLPQKPTVLASNGPTITVMTFNVFGFNVNPDGIVASLRSSNADVVSLEELNPENALAIETQLNDVYPYQILRPLVGTSGTGLISRYPMRQATDLAVGADWPDRSHILAFIDVDGQEIIFMQFHAVPPSLNPLWIEYSVRLREQQAQDIANFAREHAIPFIAAGDFNATSTSKAYAMITTVMNDSWREAGQGFGHTFPGQSGRIPLPHWLVRIDYIFHSNDWQTLSSKIGTWDGGSDHRPVLATLQLKEIEQR
jgi:vancomycin resistance protein VanJ